MSLRNERLVLEDTHVHTRPVSSLPALLMRLPRFLKAQQSNLRHSISAPDCVHSYRLSHARPFTTSPYSRILSGYRVTFACHSPFQPPRIINKQSLTYLYSSNNLQVHEISSSFFEVQAFELSLSASGSSEAADLRSREV